jgi:hypothetical protein
VNTLDFGPNRVIEGLFDVTGASYPTLTLSTSAGTPTIISNTMIFPAMPAGQLFIEKIEVVCETALFRYFFQPRTYSDWIVQRFRLAMAGLDCG